MRRLAILAFTFGFALPLAGIASAAPSGDGMGRARFSWDTIADPIVSGYKVHWGTASGVYANTVDAGNAADLIVTGFSQGVQYFAAITAYSSTGEQSDYSTEIPFIYNTSTVAAPGITFQPQGQTATAGQTVNFSVTATSSVALTYQWQKDGIPISGATSSTFTITSPMMIDAGGYAVVVTNTGGSTTSDTAALIVNPATPLITQAPVAAPITYSHTLADATLSGGTASVAGVFAFANPTSVPNAGSASQTVIFTPTDIANYNQITIQIMVTIDRATPLITEAPLTNAITYGQTLADVTLSGGMTSVTGAFAFTLPTSIPNAGSANQTVIFTPTDLTNYNPVTIQIMVTIDRATPLITEAPLTNTITYGQTLADVTLSGGVASVTGAFAFTLPTSVPNAGSANQTVIFTPTDLTNYNQITIQIMVTIDRATPLITEAPHANPITYGQPLADATLTGGIASVTGAFAFTLPTSVPNAGTTSQTVIFTPTDTANYNPVSIQIMVTIDRATPLISEAPRANSITYGQTLADATLTGGTASVAGAYAFTLPTSVPNAGTTSQTVIFTPTDTINYNTDTIQVMVTINRATPLIYVAPLTSSISYGQTLADVTLTGGTASVAGSFAFADPTIVPIAGITNQTVLFTPIDTTNYTTATVQVKVKVTKKRSTVALAPVASPITYGQPLVDATLSGGEASVEGTFAFASPTTVPNIGTANQPVTFTPSDTTNFDTAAVEVDVTVTQNFASWLNAFGGLDGKTGPTDDPDGDGIMNLMEYALAGGNPANSNRTILPVTSTVTEANQEYLAISVQKSLIATGVSFTAEVSSDLVNWNAGTGHTVVVSETANTLMVRDSSPKSNSASRYIRLKISAEQL